MNINYEYYKIFYYVAKYKSFSKAADVLSNNQPNITRIIKLLENELGCTLFARSKKGVSLTSEGEKLLAHISVVIDEIQAGENELAHDKNLESGTIHISVTEIALHELLLSVLDDYKTKYPNIKIYLSNHSTPQAINAISSKAVELAIITTPISVVSPLKATVLKSFDQFLLCGNRYTELKNKKIALKELQNYPLISLNRNTTSYEFYRDFFLRHDLIFSANMVAATTDQVLPMVINNLGLGFLPESLALPAIENGDVFRVDLIEKLPERKICLIENKDQPLGNAARELKKMLLNRAK